MDPIYTVIIAILAVLAVSGLFVGVTNDAVNFLNSAIGSKAAPRRVILIVASIGILVGTLTSSGMMEVARNGMFDPGMFSFHEVILLYLSVMFANIILLDLYNSWGLPTSTTVSLIFCLLGAAIAVSTFKIAGSDALSMGDLGEFIHTGRAFGIVAAILLSVVIALTVGTAVMYVSRLIFSFRYTRALSRYGALWCGASLTAIIYFALFKGLKGTLSQTAFIHMVENHIILSLLVCWLVCSLILFFVQIGDRGIFYDRAALLHRRNRVVYRLLTLSQHDGNLLFIRPAVRLENPENVPFELVHASTSAIVSDQFIFHIIPQHALQVKLYLLFSENFRIIEICSESGEKSSKTATSSVRPLTNARRNLPTRTFSITSPTSATRSMSRRPCF